VICADLVKVNMKVFWGIIPLQFVHQTKWHYIPEYTKYVTAIRWIFVTWTWLEQLRP